MLHARRRFLKTTAGLAAGLAARAETPAGLRLPTVHFGKYEISRLMIGCNQFYGFSHFNRLLNELMREWYTPERVVEVLHRSERNGINVYQYAHGDRAWSDLQRFRSEGGKMNLIVVNTTPTPEVELIRLIQPAGLYYHGERTDVAFRSGDMQPIREWLKRVRDTGTMAGVGTHKPEVIEYIEEHGWEVDFYVICAYNRTRTPEEVRKLLGGQLPVPAGEVYLESDPPHTFRVVRQVRKPCMVFKILAAGRVTNTPEMVDRAFSVAFDSIKPQDCVIVGMYPRYKDEVTENADRVRRILGRS